MGMEEIRQDSQVRLSAEKGNYLKMIFFNLTGRNFNHNLQFGKILFRLFCDKTEHMTTVVCTFHQTGIVERRHACTSALRNGGDKGQQSF